MRQIYHKASRYLTPVFWLSVIFLIILVVIYRFFDLPLKSFTGSIKGLGMFITMMTIFWFAGVFYRLIFCFKQWQTARQPLWLATRQTLDFSLRIIPFFIFLYIYDSVHDITHMVNGRELDALLIKIDRWLLLGNDAALMFEKIITPSLTYWFALAYLSYFLFYLVNPIVYYFIKKGRYFNEVLTTVIIANFIGLIGYFLVPCLGPVMAQQNLFSRELVLPSGKVYQDSGDLATAYVYGRGSFHCFPSLHFGISFIWLYFAWKILRPEKFYKILFYIHWPIIFFLWLATLYLRWHYAVDWLGGLATALLAIWLSNKLINWWSRRVDASVDSVDGD